MIIACLSGDTYRFRDIIKADGWKWDAYECAWWKDADWTDEDHVIRSVRGCAGIRNRGSFFARLEVDAPGD